MREMSGFEKWGWCEVEIQAEEDFQRCWSSLGLGIPSLSQQLLFFGVFWCFLVPQSWERILPSPGTSLGFGGGRCCGGVLCSVTSARAHCWFYSTLIQFPCLLWGFWLLHLSVPVFYLQLLVKSYCAECSRAGWCSLGRGSFKCGLRIPRKWLQK